MADTTSMNPKMGADTAAAAAAAAVSSRRGFKKARTASEPSTYTETSAQAGLTLPSSIQSLLKFRNSTEKRSFQFFQFITAPVLDSEFTQGFWTVIVPQFCHASPTVRHAVLALSSLHESLLDDGARLCAQLVAKQTFALNQYNKSMSLLRTQLVNSHESEPIVVLLMCILFACLEYMQKKQSDSLIHVQQGRKQLNLLITTSKHLTVDQLELVRQYFVPIYTRSVVACSSSGVYPWPIPMELNTFSSSPPAFDTIAQAGHYLYPIIDDSMCWRMLHKMATQTNPQVPTDFAYNAARIVNNVPPRPQEIATLELEQQALLSRLTRWHSAFKTFMATTTTETLTTPLVLLLQIHYYTILIWASTALAQDEMAYDAHLDSFSSVVSICRQYFKSTKHRPTEGSSDWRIGDQFARIQVTPSPLLVSSGSVLTFVQRSNLGIFDFETGVIACLFFTAAKCRHYGVRRAAADLLRDYGERQENIWSAKTSAYVAARYIDIEAEAASAAQKHSAQHLPHQAVESISPPSESTYVTTSNSTAVLETIDTARASGGSSTPHTSAMVFRLSDLFDHDRETDSTAPSSTLWSSGPHHGNVEYQTPQISSSASFDIPEQFRISEAQMLRADDKGAWWSFHRRPSRLNGDWESWEEYVEFS
ncbi:hypothetical protein BX600DRAFT_439160 [Xylariales sp. PMI_506]|nr:hypothetical protein BX600DRAFT_439160 [Xylariales sp. PMI_506]